MPGIFQSLDIARRAIWANRLGLDVASHNIANVNTPGYSRQRVQLQSARPLNLVKGQLGLGVKADQIERIRSQLLDLQYRRASHTFGRAEIEENVLLQVETVIQEPAENSIGNLITEFFSEFSRLSSEPENTTIRNTLVQKATTLVETFRGKYESLSEIQKSLRQDGQSMVNQINELIRQIAELNAQISGAEGTGGQANDLRDQRDLLLDKLSEYLDIRYVENDRGIMTVSVEGMMLVGGDKYKPLTLESYNDNGNLKLRIRSNEGQEITIRNGRLGGLLNLHNNTIQKLLDDLNTLARNLIDEVNRIHRKGKGLPVGDPPQSATGLNFFTGTDARSIEISPDIANNVANIAASLDGSVGNGEVALAIANLRNKKIFNGRTETLNDFYSTMVTTLGTEIQVAQDTRFNQQLLRDQIENQRESVSGVSLDEEMTNLIKYQRALEAAAKIVRVVDEVLETVIQMG
ncbi:MAG: flagellar hook-associated protein FlgK [Calditrichaeota bacterium]|nr:flagellar hook-associated protein FlgK [Calditrichota bacterium]